MWSIETFAVDECMEVSIILRYFQLVLFIDRIRIFLVMTHVEFGGGGQLNIPKKKKMVKMA